MYTSLRHDGFLWLVLGGGALANASCMMRRGPVLCVEEEGSSKAMQKQVPASSRPSKRAGGSVKLDGEMLKMRYIFVTGQINDETAKVFVQQLLWLEAQDPHAPVTIYINSGGGHVHSGLAMLDVMSHVSTPLHTIAYGRCCSIAVFVLAAGTRGHRLAFAHTSLMIHEPSCSYPKQQCTDIFIKVDRLKHTQQTLERILSVQTGRPQSEISDAVARDKYMSVAEAIDFGLIDAVMPSGPNASTSASVVEAAGDT